MWQKILNLLQVQQFANETWYIDSDNFSKVFDVAHEDKKNMLDYLSDEHRIKYYKQDIKYKNWNLEWFFLEVERDWLIDSLRSYLKQIYDPFFLLCDIYLATMDETKLKKCDELYLRFHKIYDEIINTKKTIR